MVCVVSFEINPTNPTVIWTFNSIRLSLQELGEEGFADSEVAIRPLTTFAQTATYKSGKVQFLLTQTTACFKI